MKTVDAVDALLRPVVAQMGYELDEVEFIKEHGNWVLTLYIEKPNGTVTLDDCEAVSRAVDPILDEADPIQQAYYLSVSSIGIDRPLKKDRDYERNLGNKITAKLYAPHKGKKEFTGELTAFDESSFTIMVNGADMKILRKDASSVRPYIDFNSLATVDINDYDNIEIEEENE